MSEGRIEVHLHALDKLFDTMDPSPLGEQDLHPNVVEHVVESAKEYGWRTPLSLTLYVDRASAAMKDDTLVEAAVRAYFVHAAQQAHRRLRLHWRRALISLVIGLAFLAATIAGGQMLGEGEVATMLQESLVIGGWVALWRPMEMFLYDWWPLWGERTLHRRLGRMRVQIQYAQAAGG